MVEIKGPPEQKKPPEQPRGMLKLKIAKKAYVFEVRKKYLVSRNFVMKKKAENPADDMKDRLREIFSKKKALPAEQVRPSGANLPQTAPPSPASTLVKSMAAFVILVLLVGLVSLGALMLGAKAAPPANSKPHTFEGGYNFSVEEADVVSVLQNDKPLRVAYFLAKYSTSNISSVNITAKVFSSRPTTQVFLLDYAREGADAYAVFRKNLMQGVREDGIAINEIDIERLSSLPAGATVVVPTGYLPKELAGQDGAYSLSALLSRGVNIIYMGFQFDRTVLNRNGLTESANYDKASFSKGKISSSDGFRLYDPQYQAGSGAKGTEGILIGSGKIYGSVSVLRFGSGAMMVLPQTIDGGWRGDGQAAGEDVARLIREELWLAPLASANATGETGIASMAAVPPQGRGDGIKTLTIFTPPFQPDSAFGEMTMSVSDMGGSMRRSISVLRLQKSQKGEMAPRDIKTVPYYLSGQRTRFNIELKEDAAKPVKLYIRLYKEGALLQEEELELGLTNPTTSKPKDMQVNAEPGKYVVRVEDTDGKTYASTQLEVIGLDIEANKTAWQTGRFTFLLSAAGQPVTPRQISVSLDGKGEKRYFPASFTYTPTSTVLNYEYPGEIKPGNHTFLFTAGNWTMPLSKPYVAPKNLWDNPLVLVLFGLAIIVTGIGAMLRRPEQMRYGLDIPDFLPLSTTKIPVKRETVLEIFESVNAGYSWQWMPLRIDEIKNGFRRLTYNGKPILVGDFNLERILHKLKDEHAVKDELGYWGLTRWEKESGHPIRYLAIYRIMRNVFVNNAVKFSRLDAMKDCDIKTIAGKEEIYLHIMQKPADARFAEQSEPGMAQGRDADAVVHRALATSKLGTTIMVFANEEERDNFRASLTSTSKLAVALKMEVNNGNIYLFPVKNAISAYLKGVVK